MKKFNSLILNRLCFSLCLCASVAICGCMATTARKTVYQVDHEREKAEEALSAASERLEGAGVDTSGLIPVQRRLDRQERLIKPLKEAFPVDFTPSDDTYDQVHAEMVELKEKMEMLRAKFGGLFKSLESLTKLVNTGLKVSTGFSFPLGGSGEREGGMAAIIILLFGLLKKHLYGKKKSEQLEQEQKSHEKTQDHFNTLTGEVNEQQHRKPGSMDDLLGSTKDKLTAKGTYVEYEAALDAAGTKTTRNSGQDAGNRG